MSEGLRLREILGVMWLSLVLILVSCQSDQKVGADDLPGVVQIGAVSEVLIPPTAGCVFDMRGEGDLLVGSAQLDGQVRSVVVDLTTSAVQRLDPMVRLTTDALVQYIVELRAQDAKGQAELWGYDFEDEDWLKLDSGQLEFPTVSGSVAVWAKRLPGESNIYGFDFEAQQHFTVTTGGGFRGYPIIADSKILYLAAHNESTNKLYVYDYETAETLFLGDTPTFEVSGRFLPERLFAVDENWAVWRTLNKEIHAYNFENSQEEIIFEGTATDSVSGVDLAGGLVIWNNGPQDKRGFDLLRREFFEVPYLPEQMQERTVAWNVILSTQHLIWIIVEDMSPDWIHGTPWSSEDPLPTLPDPMEEMERCNTRLFVAPIERR